MPPAGTILVTGGAGYIGSHAVLALRDAGHGVVVIDDLSFGHARAVPADVPLVRGDIADTVLVAQVLADHRITTIMHFAGSILVPESVANPLKYYRNNVVASNTLLQAAADHGVARFIFSSSAAVYGVPDRLPVTEDAPLLPINPYGRSKLMTEMMLRDVAAATGMKFANLRYFNVAGADPAGRAGPDRAIPTHLIEVAMDAVRGRRDGIIVAGNDYPTADGTCIRDYVHVSDLADAHVAVLNAMIAAPGASLTLNCGYGHGFSVLQVLDAVDHVLGRHLARSFGPRRAGDPAALVGSNDAIRSALNWQPRHDDLDTIIAHAIAWAQSLDQ